MSLSLFLRLRLTDVAAFWWGTQLLLRGQIVPGDIISTIRISCLMLELTAYSLLLLHPLRFLLAGPGQPAHASSRFRQSRRRQDLRRASTHAGADGWRNDIVQTIDRQPPIDVYEESGLQPEKGSFKAEFQIKNLSFVYPSRRMHSLLCAIQILSSVQPTYPFCTASTRHSVKARTVLWSAAAEAASRRVLRFC